MTKARQRDAKTRKAARGLSAGDEFLKTMEASMRDIMADKPGRTRLSVRPFATVDTFDNGHIVQRRHYLGWDSRRRWKCFTVQYGDGGKIYRLADAPSFVQFMALARVTETGMGPHLVGATNPIPWVQNWRRRSLAARRTA